MHSSVVTVAIVIVLTICGLAQLAGIGAKQVGERAGDVLVEVVK